MMFLESRFPVSLLPGFWPHTHWSSSPISVVRTAEAPPGEVSPEKSAEFWGSLASFLGLFSDLFFLPVSWFFSLKIDLKNLPCSPILYYPTFSFWSSHHQCLGGLQLFEGFGSPTDWRLNGGKFSQAISSCS